MKKVYYGVLLAVISVALSSCSGLFGGKNEPEFSLSDLQGLWLQDQDTTEHYVRFTTESSDEAGYLLGREWHEYHGGKKATYESDLLEQREFDGFPGNGWFKYQFEVKESALEEIHFMTNGGAEIPKDFVVTKLNATSLEYYEKDKKQNKYYFTKVKE